MLAVSLSLIGCGKGEKSDKVSDIEPEILAQVLKTGEAQAIVKLIARAKQSPCQPIYLFNNVDSNNKQEVNLINVACESLNLPKVESTNPETQTP